MMTVSLVIDGREVRTLPNRSLLEARLEWGLPVVKGLGCMGQGICGSCRVFVRRAGQQDVKTALACETRVEEGMQVAFLDYFPPHRDHVYKTEDLSDIRQAAARIAQIFPEATHCRHCGGCDRSCPKGLEVEKGVNLAVVGDLPGSAAAFEMCVMCNLCTAACPDHIAPNHLGVFVRRVLAVAGSGPPDLMQRLMEIETATMQIDLDLIEPVE
jgi:succinate dehydrogenase/fumarate reductase-like Fe-S protein